MSDFTNAQRDAEDLAKLVNENSEVTTRYGDNPKKSYSLVIDEIESDAAAKIQAAANSFNLSPSGFDFATGGTLTSNSQTVSDGGGNEWIYTLEIPEAGYIVAAGTDPTVGTDYKQVGYNQASNVSYSENGNVENALRKRAAEYTLAEAQGADLEIGQYVKLTDRAGATYKVQPVGLSPNGFDIVAGTGGTVLEYCEVGKTYVTHIGAIGNGTFDNSAVFNRAVELFNVTHVPTGVFAIGSPIRKSGPNPIQREIVGDSKDHAIIKALPTLTNSALIWFGNSTGYGAQYIHISNLTVDGNDRDQNCTGILYQSCGISSVRDVTFRELGRTFWGLGCIDTHLIDCDHFRYYQGPFWTVYLQGDTNGNLDDLENQQTQTTNANTSSMVRNWLSNGVSTATYISGAQFRLEGCVYQSATNDVTETYAVVEVEDSNESYDYGAGPIIHNNWVEGGQFTYALSVKGTAQSSIHKNIFNGIFNSGSGQMEGGVYVDATSVKNLSLRDNAFRGYYDAPPSQGRLSNASYYIENSSFSTTADIRDNYNTLNTTQPYYAGLESPKVDRGPLNLFATVTGLTSTPKIDFTSCDFIQSITINGVGDITFTYSFNRQVLSGGGKYPVMVTCHTTGGAVTYPAGHLTSTTQADRFIFNDDSGTPATPEGLTLHLLGGGRQ